MTNPLLTTFREKFLEGTKEPSPNETALVHILSLEQFILYAEQKTYERALVECEEALPKEKEAWVDNGELQNAKEDGYNSTLSDCREAIRSKGKKL